MTVEQDVEDHIKDAYAAFRDAGFYELLDVDLRRVVELDQRTYLVPCVDPETDEEGQCFAQLSSRLFIPTREYEKSEEQMLGKVSRAFDCLYYLADQGLDVVWVPASFFELPTREFAAALYDAHFSVPEQAAYLRREFLHVAKDVYKGDLKKHEKSVWQEIEKGVKDRMKGSGLMEVYAYEPKRPDRKHLKRLKHIADGASQAVYISPAERQELLYTEGECSLLHPELTRMGWSRLVLISEQYLEQAIRYGFMKYLGLLHKIGDGSIDRLEWFRAFHDVSDYIWGGQLEYMHGDDPDVRRKVTI